MCVDSDTNKASVGATCEYSNMNPYCYEYCDLEDDYCETLCKDVDTAKDYNGYPMIQDYVFGNKRFCGQKIKTNEEKRYGNFENFANVERSLTCSEGKRNCGFENEPICIDSVHECPITKIKLLSKQDTNYTMEIDGFEIIDFMNEDFVLASSRD